MTGSGQPTGTVATTVGDWAPFGWRWLVLIVAFSISNVPWIAGFLVDDRVRLIDARIYWEAARTYVTGGNPWMVSISGIPFAAPPTTLLLYVPFVPLGNVAGPVVVTVLSAIAVVWSVRRLGLPAPFIAWPPLVNAVVIGSGEPIVLACLLSAHGWLGAVLKPYTGLTLLIQSRWRDVAIAVVIAALLVPLWGIYLSHFSVVATASSQHWFGQVSAAALPWTYPIALVLLVLRGRARAAWLAVPMLLPMTQPHYAVLALPALSTAGALLIGIPWLPASAVWAVGADQLHVTSRYLRLKVDGRRTALASTAGTRGVVSRTGRIEG